MGLRNIFFQFENCTFYGIWSDVFLEILDVFLLNFGDLLFGGFKFSLVRNVNNFCWFSLFINDLVSFKCFIFKTGNKLSYLINCTFFENRLFIEKVDCTGIQFDLEFLLECYVLMFMDYCKTTVCLAFNSSQPLRIILNSQFTKRFPHLKSFNINKPLIFLVLFDFS